MSTPTLFVLSWERPIFLWATLDSIYRNTRRDLNIILIDNGSRNPDVHDIINGFSRRDMFAEIRKYGENRPDRMGLVYQQYQDHLGPYFFFCENDVVVPERMCWASEYEKIWKQVSDIGMIGSFCDKSDFIDPQFIRRKEPGLSDAQVQFYSKSESPERRVVLPVDTNIWPHEAPNPPGRLLLLSKEAIHQVGVHPDAVLALKMKEKGFRSIICTSFVHRHLSLMNWYDVKDRTYGETRNSFFAELSQEDSRFERKERLVDQDLIGLEGASLLLHNERVLSVDANLVNETLDELLDHVELPEAGLGLHDSCSARVDRKAEPLRNASMRVAFLLRKTALFLRKIAGRPKAGS